jgi:hypothetical protein
MSHDTFEFMDLTGQTELTHLNDAIQDGFLGNRACNSLVELSLYRDENRNITTEDGGDKIEIIRIGSTRVVRRSNSAGLISESRQEMGHDGRWKSDKFLAAI